VQGTPDRFRSERCVEMPHIGASQGVYYRVHQGHRAGDGGKFPDTFEAQGIGGRQRLKSRHVQHGHIVGARDGIIQQAARSGWPSGLGRREMLAGTTVPREVRRNTPGKTCPLGGGTGGLLRAAAETLG
jgi:hypothetical protein